MKKIKIKAPVNSLQSAKMQIAAGAEENLFELFVK